MSHRHKRNEGPLGRRCAQALVLAVVVLSFVGIVAPYGSATADPVREAVSRYDMSGCEGSKNTTSPGFGGGSMFVAPDGQVVAVELSQFQFTSCAEKYVSIYDEGPVIVSIGPAGGTQTTVVTQYVGWELVDVEIDATGIYVLYSPSTGKHSGDLFLGKISWTLQQSPPVLIQEFGRNADPYEDVSMVVKDGQYFVVWGRQTSTTRGVVIEATSTFAHKMHRQRLVEKLDCVSGLPTSINSAGQPAFAYIDRKKHRTCSDRAEITIRSAVGKTWRTTHVGETAGRLLDLELQPYPVVLSTKSDTANRTILYEKRGGAWSTSVVPLPHGSVKVVGTSVFVLGTKSGTNFCLLATSSGTTSPWTVSKVGENYASDCRSEQLQIVGSDLFYVTSQFYFMQLWKY